MKIHEISRDFQVILGSGYGKMKKTTFRLANFPNIKMTDLEKFAEILKNSPLNLS
jgi:aspartate aminotransferase-like enzyme